MYPEKRRAIVLVVRERRPLSWSRTFAASLVEDQCRIGFAGKTALQAESIGGLAARDDVIDHTGAAIIEPGPGSSPQCRV